MTFATLKKQFTRHLKKPAREPTSGFLEMGEFDRSKGQHESEGDYSVLVDPEGDAWVFLGPHEALVRKLKQESRE